MKTSELTGNALDRAVAECEGQPSWVMGFSTEWEKGGPIIEREGISIVLDDDIDAYSWTATCIKPPYVLAEQGSTPLIAAMRCYVSSKLGEEVEIRTDTLKTRTAT